MKFENHPQYQNPEIKIVLDRLVDGALNILDRKFIGAWLQGSMATGHFDEHSDIDFVIGIENDLTREELDSLHEFHRQLFEFESPWSKHLEGSYIPREILVDYTRAGEKVWYLDHGSTTFERSDHDNTIAVKWIVREKGVVLAGPEPSEIMAPIPVAELRKDSYRTFAKWAEVIFQNHDEIGSHFYQTFAVLSYARMLHTVQVGEIHSKRDGAEWAKANLDPKWHDLIDKSWLGRHDPSLSSKRPANPKDLKRTVEFIKLCLSEARKLMRSYGHEPDSVFDAA